MKILYKEGHKPIKHSAVSSDGGFLETTVTGVTNLSHGSIVYGDAGEIVTELPAGAQNEVLTMGVNNPAWSAGASGAWTLLESRVNGSSIDFGSVGGADLSGYNFCRVIGSFVTAAAGDYFCLAFQNQTAMITTYSSQGLYGTRSIPVSWLTSNSGAQNILAYTDGTPPSAVTFQMDFSVTSASGALAANNHFCHQTCSANGGNGNTAEYNTSVVTFPSTSDICSFIAQAGPSGGIISPVSNSVQMSVFAS